jgi:hypothetical protein
MEVPAALENSSDAEETVALQTSMRCSKAGSGFGLRGPERAAVDDGTG